MKAAGAVEVGFLNQEQAQFGQWIQPWLDAGYHGDMTWMERNGPLRSDPCTVLENGKSIISIAFPYLTELPEQWASKRLISNYAWGEDYHQVLKKKLKKVLQDIKQIVPEFKGRAFVDSAPLPEKIIAAACGIGWIGKNSLLISPKWGSYIFLAEIVCNLDLISTPSIDDKCGDCNLCVEACPNRAIRGNRSVAATRCTSYLTIEKKGAFTKEEAKGIHHRLFGCDCCQLACPWNVNVPIQHDSPYGCDPKWLTLKLNELTELSQSEFDQLKIKSPLKRLKLEGLHRNAKAIRANGPPTDNWD